VLPAIEPGQIWERRFDDAMTPPTAKLARPLRNQ